MSRPPLTLYLAAPRGFCAGVDRAIKIVEVALEKYGAPVYVRHEIVHNRHVVETLERKGAVFIDELDEAPLDVPAAGAVEAPLAVGALLVQLEGVGGQIADEVPAPVQHHHADVDEVDAAAEHRRLMRGRAHPERGDGY